MLWSRSHRLQAIGYSGHSRVFLSPDISWNGANMIEQIMAPFFTNVIAFGDDKAQQDVVDTSACY
ncbi:MAG: hypothetical protein ACI9LY_001914 [Arenicella sp.]|jgi:hypothetical protein|tara:strand:- start:433 stop:627 length:195 start_codon:yes stop_codon:yes gene_type:complete